MRTTLPTAFTVVALGLVLAASSAHAAEICGNGLDDDGDGLEDEGCYPTLTTGQCESPLSCGETGMISPSTGSLRYQLPADVAPQVPYGPGIGLRRFYTSMYAPGASPPVYRTAMGDRWQHTYMTWLVKTGAAPTSTLSIHTSRGQDLRAVYSKPQSGWDYYTPQTGAHYKSVSQRTTAPFEFQLVMLTGETLVYSSAGRLTEIWDTLAIPNKVLIAYDANGQVSTVTDASGKRRLLFAYTSSKLSSVAFQISIASVWTTQHTTSYAYTGNNLTTVTFGGQLAQTNVYTSNYLTQIQDGSGQNLVTFAYDAATPGKTVRASTPRGTLGFELNSTRTGCAGPPSKTVLYFNLGNATSCNVDADCGAGFLCGGKTSTGATGQCFRGARCLTISSPSEDVVTTVTPIGPPGQTCDGACTDIAQYVWNTGTGILDLGATQDPIGNYSSRKLNGYGLPTTITYGDADANPDNTNHSRVEWRFYSASFPGLVSEVRRKSDLSGSASSCSATVATGCAQTLYTYNTDGKLVTQQENGFTLNSSNVAVGYTYTTTFSYDGKGRLLQIDGPLAGSNDVTQFEYWTPTGAFTDDFLHNFKRKKDATNYLIETAAAYDFWGNATSLVDVDGTMTCLTFDSARGYLKKRSEAMAGQTDCTANAADLVTQWARDSALRLTQLTRPDGSCVFYEYTGGRLVRTKRRDDCNAASAGDKQEFVYDAEGLLTEIQTYDAASTLVAKQPLTYFDSRRLEKVVNPVDASKWTGIVYDVAGQLNEITGAGGLSRVRYNRSTVDVSSPGREGRVTSVDKYASASVFDTWSLFYAWLGSQATVTDGDAKSTLSTRDDLGRMVRVQAQLDVSYPTLRLYDEASRLTTIVENVGYTGTTTHTFSFDNVGRPLDNQYAGYCVVGSQPPEIQRVYDAPPGTCPMAGGCNRTAGRLAYVKAKLLCVSGLGTDGSLDQETFYSYDPAGRLAEEYIRDDAGRVADHVYAWTKNGDLAQATMPSGAVIGWTHGSATQNSDTDRVTEVWRTSSASQVVSAVQWNPYGPLQQYTQANTHATVALRTRIARNLAYRVTGIYVEDKTGANLQQSVVVTEDAKGRVTSRDYFPNTSGVQDSYFLYDQQDRVLCETTSSVSSCPSTGTNIKNSHTAAPPFTHAGDWQTLKRPIPGSTGGLANLFNPTGYGTSHRLTLLRQNDGTPALGDTTYSSYISGDRETEDNISTQTNDLRGFLYDPRHNVIDVFSSYKPAGTWNTLETSSGFDAQNRRVFKQNYNWDTGKIATWFFYYDPLDRLTEVRFTPDTTVPATYTVFQLFWLGDRLTAYWQTDYPSVTTSKRFVDTDETGRPIDMMSWPATGDAARVWAINPSAWGVDTNAVGPGVYQPILFAGQYQDVETAAYLNDGATVHRPGVALNGFRTYDPFTGSYLQVDPLADRTWSSYVYAGSDPVGKIDPDGLWTFGSEVCGNGKIYIPDVGCTSADTSIVNCWFDNWGSFSCKSIWEGTLADCNGWSPGPGCPTGGTGGGGGSGGGAGGGGTGQPGDPCSLELGSAVVACSICPSPDYPIPRVASGASTATQAAFQSALPVGNALSTDPNGTCSSCGLPYCRCLGRIANAYQCNKCNADCDLCEKARDAYDFCMNGKL